MGSMIYLVNYDVNRKGDNQQKTD